MGQYSSETNQPIKATIFLFFSLTYIEKFIPLGKKYV